MYRGPCFVRNRLLLDGTTLTKLWDVAGTLSAVKHSAWSSVRSIMLCSDGPHRVWQYALHAAYIRVEGWNLRDDAAWDGVLYYKIDMARLEIDMAGSVVRA